MNKLFTKIAKIFLGLSMAAGVGVAVGSNSRGATPVHAVDPVVVSISDIASSNDWVDATAYTSWSFNSDITISTAGTGDNGKYYVSNSSWRLYENNSGALTIAGVSGVTLSSITFTYSNKNSGVLKNGSSNVASGSAVSISGQSFSFTGVSHSGGSKSGNIQITQISITYTKVAAKTLSSIAITTPPTLTSYLSGSSFDPTGLEITPTYSDGVGSLVTYAGNENKFAFSPTTITQAGNVSCTYTDSYGSASTDIAVTLATVTSVTSVSTSPASVYVGGTVSPSEVKLNVGLSNGQSAVVDATSITLDTSVEKNNVTGTAYYNSVGSATFTINVIPAPKIYSIVPKHDATSDSSSAFSSFSSENYEFDADALTSSSGSRMYNGKNNTIKIGSDGNKGSITISLKKAAEYITSVVVNAFKYGSDTNKISVVPTGGAAITPDPNTNLATTAADYTFSITGTSCTSFSLTTSSAKRGYINSISIYYAKIEPVAMTLTGAGGKSTITSLTSTLQLTATAYSDSQKTSPIDGLTFTYSSGSTSVATVDENGLVTPVSTGQSVITARYSATLSADITITVLYVSVDLINDGSVLEASSSGTFSYSWSSDSLKPSSPSVTWSASGSGVTITNASTGAYTAGAVGSSATVTVTVTKDGYTYTASRDFSVVSSVVLPTHISVTESSGVLTYVGSEVSLHITVLGENDEEATNQNVVCSSSNTDVLTVSNTGVITAKARGLVTVTIVDEGSLCDPVEVSVRVRNVVRSEAPLIGSADVGATKNYSSTNDFVETYYTEGTATPTVTISGQNATKPSNITWSYTCLRLATGSGSGSVTFTYASSVEIKTVVVSALGWDSDECDGLSISDASLEEGELNYNVGFTDLVFAFEEVTNSFTITCQSGHRAYISEIKVYGEKSDGSSSENAQAVYTFEETYMHLDDYNSNLGYCNDSEHHYYSSAKSAFNALTEPRRKLFLENEAFAEAKERLIAWAEVNNESINASYQLSSNRNILPVLLNQNTNTIAIIVIISMVSVTAIGGYFFLRKRNEN